MPNRDPWIKFYPDDWNGDLELASCSLAAQGLMARLIAVLHRSEPYGYLLCNGSEPRPADISRVLGISPNTYRACLAELLEKGVLKRDEIGIYSERMVRDQRKREEARRAGVKGGNPILVKGRVNPPDNGKVKGRVKLEEEKEEDKEAEAENIPVKGINIQTHEDTRTCVGDPLPDPRPKEKFSPPGGYEPTETSKAAAAEVVKSLEAAWGVYPFTPAQTGDGRQARAMAELESICRLLEPKEVTELVMAAYERRVKESKGADRPTNLPFYLGLVKEAFFARNRELEEAERRRDEAKRSRARASPEEPASMSGLLEEVVEETEMTEEERQRVIARIRQVREQIAKAGKA